MKEQTGPFGQRSDALDGLRALAVFGVLAFHSGASWASGAFLGVSLFFTLSGFLITAILLHEFQTTGAVNLRSFWSRRFRRLLPAALAVIGLVVVISLWWEPSLANLRGDVVAAVTYAANWHFIADGQSYSDLFVSPSPLLHFWSLAIEEQFYVVFPLLFVGLVRFGASRAAIVRVLATLAVAATVLPVALGGGDDRLYYGADARAAELLIGAILAALMVDAGRYRVPSGQKARLLAWVGPLALLALLVSWNTAEQGDWLLPRGGLALHAVLAGAVIVAALLPESALAKVLASGPFPWLGRISYSLYLIHWPVFVWLDAGRVGTAGPALHVVRVAVSIGLAAALYYLVERRFAGSLASGGQRRWVLAAFPFAVVLVVAAVTVPIGEPPAVIDEAVADSARPPALQGATFEEIAASAAAAQEAPESTLRTNGSEPANSTAIVEAPDPMPAPVGFSLEFQRPEGGIALDDAQTIVRTGSGHKVGEASDIGGKQEPIFDYESSATRIVVFGDSAAVMLGFGLGDWTRANGNPVQFRNLGVVGCGLVRSDERQMQPAPVQDNRAKCGDWEPAFEALRDIVEPELVVMSFGLWDVVEHRVVGASTAAHVGVPVFDAYVLSEISAATSIFTDAGIPVVWLTTPRLGLSQGRPQLNGEPWPVEDPARVERFNELIGEAAAENPLMAVVDLHAWFEALPDGPLDPSLRPDGVHVTYQSSATVGLWLGPAIVEAFEQVGSPDP